jgi:hypothetical protein
MRQLLHALRTLARTPAVDQEHRRHLALEGPFHHAHGVARAAPRPPRCRRRSTGTSRGRSHGRRARGCAGDPPRGRHPARPSAGVVGEPRRAAVARDRVVVAQQLRHLGVAVLQRQVERRLAAGVPGVDVAALAHDDTHQIGVAAGGGGVEHARAVLLRRVGVAVAHVHEPGIGRGTSGRARGRRPRRRGERRPSRAAARPRTGRRPGRAR